MGTQNVPRDEAEAALAARRELGAEFEPAVVDSFVDRLDEAIETRVNAAVERRLENSDVSARQRQKAASERSGQSLTLAIVSIVTAVPTSIVVSEKAGVAGLLLVWSGLVLINLAFNLGNRFRG